MNKVILTLTMLLLPSLANAAGTAPGANPGGGCQPQKWTCKDQSGQDRAKDILKYYEDNQGQQYGKLCFPNSSPSSTSSSGSDPQSASAGSAGSDSSASSSSTTSSAQSQEKLNYDEMKNACENMMKGKLAASDTPSGQ